MNEIKKLLIIIESFRKKNHSYVDEDCWYSCPGHEDYCGEDEHICRCGLAEHNAKVDKALQLLRNITPDSADLKFLCRCPVYGGTCKFVGDNLECINANR